MASICAPERPRESTLDQNQQNSDHNRRADVYVSSPKTTFLCNTSYAAPLEVPSQGRRRPNLTEVTNVTRDYSSEAAVSNNPASEDSVSRMLSTLEEHRSNIRWIFISIHGGASITFLDINHLLKYPAIID